VTWHQPVGDCHGATRLAMTGKFFKSVARQSFWHGAKLQKIAALRSQ